MQPIGNAWSKLPRLVRDLAKDLGRSIELEMKGADTELDRQVIELIKDPLTHMVRNSADHGLETPEERTAAGKSKTGHIYLNAYHAGGHIIIEVGDDGRGLNLQKIKEKIIQKGLSTTEEIESYSENQIYQYIFHAGFSTAQNVTNVSGRGVGMDVVRTNIEKIGGSIELASTPGLGTTFTIKIPLTLAIVSALIIQSGDCRFAIPQVSISELVRTDSSSEYAIEYVNGEGVLRLRNQLLPLVSLGEMLQISADNTTNLKDHTLGNSVLEKPVTKDGYIVVLQVGSSSFGVMVDDVYDTEEIVVKPVSPILRSMTLFAGNTILGDGSVVMILDPKGVMSKMGYLGSTQSHEKINKENDFIEHNKMAFLLFRNSDQTLKTVPLEQVVRLEEIKGSSIEISNGQMMVQYRDRLMPLLSLNGYLNVDENLQKPVLVFEDRGFFVGIIVDEIIDIVDSQVDIKLKSSQIGSYGNLVINDHAIDLIDVHYYIRQIFPKWQSRWQQNGSSHHKYSIILIDGCPLYRHLMTSFLFTEDYDVKSWDSCQKSFNYLEESLTTDMILVDENLLDLHGQEFMSNIKEIEGAQNIPIVVLSEDINQDHYNHYLQEGFADCLPKNDRDRILRSIETIFNLMRSTTP